MLTPRQNSLHSKQKRGILSMDAHQDEERSRTYFIEGLANLQEGKLEDGVTNYLLGCWYSPNVESVFSVLTELGALGKKRTSPPGADLVKKILLLYLAFRQQSPKAQTRLKFAYFPKEKKIIPQVVIIAGSTAKNMEETVERTTETLLSAFKGYKGTIISGGTSAGVSGIAGALQERYASTTRVIGYVPKVLPADVMLDTRYSIIHHTDGETFSIKEPLQYWVDIALSRSPPEQVAVLGVGGGRISSFEYRLAALLGVRVGIIAIPDWNVPLSLQHPTWQEVLIHLKNEPLEVSKFLLQNR